MVTRSIIIHCTDMSIQISSITPQSTLKQLTSASAPVCNNADNSTASSESRMSDRVRTTPDNHADLLLHITIINRINSGRNKLEHTKKLCSATVGHIIHPAIFLPSY